MMKCRYNSDGWIAERMETHGLTVVEKPLPAVPEEAEEPEPLS